MVQLRLVDVVHVMWGMIFIILVYQGNGIILVVDTGNTLPKFNIAPEKWWLEDYFLLGWYIFRGMLNFQGVCFLYLPNNDQMFNVQYR